MENRKGYARTCKNCITGIWMQKCDDGYWRAFDFPGNTQSGRWENHKKNCSGVV